VVHGGADDPPDHPGPARVAAGGVSGAPVHPQLQRVAGAGDPGAAGGGVRRVGAGGVRDDGGVAPDDVKPAAGGRATEARVGGARGGAGAGGAGRGGAARGGGEPRGGVRPRGQRDGGLQGKPGGERGGVPVRVVPHGGHRRGGRPRVRPAGGAHQGLINRGGEKISPIEVDAVLLGLPGVAQAVSFGVPDDKYGEEINCALIPRDGSALREEEVLAHCRRNLASFKVPKKVFITDDLPKTATGKIQRRIVAQHFVQPTSA
jgi:hypothetical protein